MHRDLNRYRTAFKELEAENTALTKKNKELADKSKESLIKKMKMLELERDYAAAMEFINRIPTEVLSEYESKFAPPQKGENCLWTKNECLIRTSFDVL